MPYVITRMAREDIDSIWHYIALDSVEHADLVEEAIYATCRLAAMMPDLGHKRADLPGTEIRFLTVNAYNRYSIAFERGSNPLNIVGVIHGARDVSKLFSSQEPV